MATEAGSRNTGGPDDTVFPSPGSQTASSNTGRQETNHGLPERSWRPGLKATEYGRSTENRKTAKGQWHRDEGRYNDEAGNAGGVKTLTTFETRRETFAIWQRWKNEWKVIF